MRSIFELTTPRDEVLHGELSEEMFAARLKDVMENAAEPVYQDPDRFFANTWPTAGLRSLLREVLGRQTGRQGYLAEAQQRDVNRVAPGTGLFERLIGSRPTLIMVDEIARACAG